ncbi:hypothetical protein BSKO_00888 [Bryopsis sp. KO-2023]|nr:hypothetical protein BSKO_00888 [Bryopsis sp. KO-2023]
MVSQTLCSRLPLTSSSRLSKTRAPAVRAGPRHPEANRRDVFLGLLASTALVAGPAAAVDVDAAKKAKLERKRALREAAEDMKTTGVEESAFEDSKFAVSEDKTPNIHSRQEEGKRSQVNA